MTRNPFHKIIMQDYLKPKSAQQVAAEINQKYRLPLFTAAKVLQIWNQEVDSNFLLQQLGERPLHGFDPEKLDKQTADKVLLCESVMAVA